MFAYLHYRSAKARLKQSNETIAMMGGWDECQPMLQGQHEMVQLEMEYYKSEYKKTLRIVLFCVTLAIPLVLHYYKIF